jgi:hypothetical protein
VTGYSVEVALLLTSLTQISLAKAGINHLSVINPLRRLPPQEKESSYISVVDPDPHQIERWDLDPQQSDKVDSDPHQSNQLDPDPHQSGKQIQIKVKGIRSGSASASK